MTGLSPPHRVRPRFRLAVVAVVAAFLAWRIVRSAVAPLPLPVPPDAEAARSVLAREPLASDAYRALAVAADGAGQEERALRLMQVVAAWWPRDPAAQTWLLARNLRRGDYPAAADRLDALARVRPDLLEALTEALAPLLAEPAANAALADRLAADPPWRPHFIDAAVRQWREPDGLIRLLDRLQDRPPGLRRAELRPLLNRLVADGRGEQAYRMWLRSLPGDRLARLALLHNGDFAEPVSDMPFDWRLPPGQGAAAAVTGEAGARILTVGFLGGRVGHRPVEHDLVLAPGTYRLTGRARTDRLRTERGVRWRVACLDAGDGALATSAAFAGTTAWQDFAVTFTVPDEGCPAQRLSLALDARTALEQQITGVASFANLAITSEEEASSR